MSDMNEVKMVISELECAHYAMGLALPELKTILATETNPKEIFKSMKGVLDQYKLSEILS